MSLRQISLNSLTSLTSLNSLFCVSQLTLRLSREQSNLFELPRRSRVGLPKASQWLTANGQFCRQSRVGWLTQNREFNEIKEVKEFSDRLRLCVYSDLGCCRKAVKEKISTKGQACLQPKVDIFYFNNSQSYPKSASAQKKNAVFPRVFGAPFCKKAQYRQFCVTVLRSQGYRRAFIAAVCSS